MAPLVVVVGAGPSGLVAIKTLVESGFDVVCFEASKVSQFGGTFTNKVSTASTSLANIQYLI